MKLQSDMPWRCCEPAPRQPNRLNTRAPLTSCNTPSLTTRLLCCSLITTRICASRRRGDPDKTSRFRSVRPAKFRSSLQNVPKSILLHGGPSTSPPPPERAKSLPNKLKLNSYTRNRKIVKNSKIGRIGRIGRFYVYRGF